MVSCIVPAASTPDASGSTAHNLEVDDGSGFVAAAIRSCLTVAGDAVPPCVPSSRKAGPGPDMMMRAAESPTIGNRADSIQVDFDRPRDAILTSSKAERPWSGGDGMLNRTRVVGLPVSHRTEMSNGVFSRNRQGLFSTQGAWRKTAMQQPKIREDARTVNWLRMTDELVK